MTDYLTLDDVRGLHANVMRRTGFLPAPLRDVGALESAIMRPQTVAHYEGADLLTQGVTLMLAMSQAQAFVDGNKRIAFIAATLFLERNGVSFTAPEAEATIAMLRVAEGSMNEKQLARWFHEHTTKSRRS